MSLWEEVVLYGDPFYYIYERVKTKEEALNHGFLLIDIVSRNLQTPNVLDRVFYCLIKLIKIAFDYEDWKLILNSLVKITSNITPVTEFQGFKSARVLRRLIKCFLKGKTQRIKSKWLKSRLSILSDSRTPEEFLITSISFFETFMDFSTLVARYGSYKEHKLYQESIKPRYEKLIRRKITTQEELDIAREHGLSEEKFINIYLIKECSLEAKAYILGFDVSKGIPDEKEVDRQFEEFRQHGVDNYVVPDKLDSSSKSRNDKDTLYNSIESYSMFDILELRQSGHVYYFTRPEFESLLKRKVNHYNNLPLPEVIMIEMSAKLVSADSMNLPCSKPLKDLLTGDIEMKEEVPIIHIEII